MGEKMTLLPCPFCGNKDDFEGSRFPNGRRTSWIVRCGVPNCSCEIIGDSPQDVTKRWNTRHLATPAQTVDVDAVREVIASHRNEIQLCNKHDQESIDYLTEQADKLSKAIGDKT